MKKKIVVLSLLAALLCFVFASCGGQKAVNNVEILTGLKYTYQLNETPDFSGVQAKISYNDGSFVVVGADKLEFGALDTSTAGTKNLTIAYGDYTISIKVSVSGGGSGGGDDAPVLESIAYFDGLEESYLIGSDVDLSSVRISALYSDGQVQYVTADKLTFVDRADTTSVGAKTITVEYGGKRTTINYSVYVVAELKVSAAASDKKISLGEAFDTSKLTVIATIYDGTNTVERPVTAADGVEFSALDTSTVGKKTLTVSYLRAKAEIEITVNGVTKLSVNTMSFKDVVMKGESFDFSKLYVDAVYFDGTRKNVAISDIAFSSVDTSVQGETAVTLTYAGVSASVALRVDDLESIEIDAASVNTVRPEGDDTPIDYSGIKLIGHYYYSASKELTFGLSDLTVTQPAWGEEDMYFVVSYLGKEAKIKITETDPVVEALEASASNSKVYLGNAFDPNVLAIYAIYTNGAREKLALDNADLSIGAIDVSAAGVKTVTVSYLDFEASVEITVIGIKELLVDTSEIQTVFYKDSQLADNAFSQIRVTPVYTDDTVGNRISFADLSLGAIDLTTAGEQTLSVAYYGVTAEVEITVKGIASLLVSGHANKVVVGDAYATDGITVVVQYTDGSSETVANRGNLKFELDTSVANDGALLKVTFFGLYEVGVANVPVKVLGITSIAVKAETLPSSIRFGDELDTSALVIIATLSDGTQKEYGVGAEAIGATVSGDLSEAGKKNNVTVTFRGVSATVAINVTSADADYIVFGVDYDANLAAFLAAEGNKKQFKNKNYTYVVGYQNPFRFTLKIDALDDDLEPSIITSYQSLSKVYLVEGGSETLLSGDALAQYVSIDESAGKNAFQFTKAAENKTFRIETRPATGVIEGTEANNTKSLTVKVVNAWNVYEAWELNLITNRNNEIGSEGSGVMQMDVVTTFLANNGVARPADLGGIVIHKNLTIEMSDLPAEYFYTLTVDTPYKYEGKDGKWYDATWTAGSKFLWEQFNVYSYEHNETSNKFEIYGNYFTIYTYKLPCVAPKGTANNTDDLSSSQIFKFDANDTMRDNGAFDHTKYTVNINSLFLRDDDGSDNDNSSSMRHMLGAIAIKTAKCITNLENVNIYAYYISLFADYDCLTINVNECDLYNAWQNHIMSWANNNIDDDNSTPHENHTGIIVNITNSRVAKCGGPVIIAMTCDPEYTAQNVSRAEYNIDDKSEIFSYVTGQEAWFTALGATQIVGTIKAMNGLPQMGGGSFMTTLPGNGDTKFMNLIMVNMVSASDASALLTGTADVDGKLSIGGDVILDMNDVYGTYGNPYVAGYKQHAMLGAAPIFQSSNGSVAAGIIGDATGVDAVTGTPNSVGVAIQPGVVVANGLYQQDPSNATVAIGKAESAIYEGDYLSIYYGQFGLVFGYNETVQEGSGY